MSAPGILAIWNDCIAGHEAAYEAWYQGEHLLERLAVPGFRIGRRFRRVDGGGGPEYFTYYETDTADVLITQPYTDLLDTPSPLTTRIMTESFRNMSRTVCRVAGSWGAMRGAWAVAVKLDAGGEGAAADLLAATESDPAIARAELWTAVAEPPRAQTEEEKLRGGDKKIAACVLVETLAEDTARVQAEALASALGAAVQETGIYGLMCDLVAPAGRG